MSDPICGYIEDNMSDPICGYIEDNMIVNGRMEHIIFMTKW